MILWSWGVNLNHMRFLVVYTGLVVETTVLVGEFCANKVTEIAIRRLLGDLIHIETRY